MGSHGEGNTKNNSGYVRERDSVTDRHSKFLIHGNHDSRVQRLGGPNVHTLFAHSMHGLDTRIPIQGAQREEPGFSTLTIRTSATWYAGFLAKQLRQA